MSLAQQQSTQGVTQYADVPFDNIIGLRMVGCSPVLFNFSETAQFRHESRLKLGAVVGVYALWDAHVAKDSLIQSPGYSGRNRIRNGYRIR